MIRRVLHWLTANVLASPRVIYDRAGKSPYLSRWYLIGKEPAVDEFGNPVKDKEPPSGVQLYLHRFHQSDEGDHHNHPFKWMISWVIAGGYIEERSDLHGVITTRTLVPGRFNFLRAGDFHKVILRQEDAWSFFLVGPRTQSWGFRESATGAIVHWRTYLARVRSAS